MADHPLIHALVAELPPKGEPFTPKQRRRWLETLKGYLDLIYAQNDEDADQERVSPNGVASVQRQLS